MTLPKKDKRPRKKFPVYESYIVDSSNPIIIECKKPAGHRFWDYSIKGRGGFVMTNVFASPGGSHANSIWHMLACTIATALHFRDVHPKQIGYIEDVDYNKLWLKEVCNPNYNKPMIQFE